MNRRSFLSKLLALPVIGAIAAKVVPAGSLIETTAVNPLRADNYTDPLNYSRPVRGLSIVCDPDVDPDHAYLISSDMFFDAETRRREILRQRTLYADGRWGLDHPEAKKYLADDQA